MHSMTSASQCTRKPNLAPFTSFSSICFTTASHSSPKCSTSKAVSSYTISHDQTVELGVLRVVPSSSLWQICRASARKVTQQLAQQTDRYGRNEQRARKVCNPDRSVSPSESKAARCAMVSVFNGSLSRMTSKASLRTLGASSCTRSSR